ncbi:protein nessun dorma [Copidosoma floridanum]|uniref:protein nessun dorma n=1 Tax=Copidosoma floridanum TaxID=29053 RepID=UPI0006C9A209|nr:protein nessun dorma [Copidosoma floridanum]
MEIFTFDKCFQERLEEFTNIIVSGREDVIPATQVRTEWIYHVELVVEPVGWRALWKIPRLTCEDFKIHYPTIVAVEVENVDYMELMATVKIVAVQDDDIHLPEHYDVPLIELYATREQENSVLDILATAECIDKLRFFYNYLWMPWDTDDDDNIDWVSNYLEDRLRLFFDMKTGVVCKKTCDIIRTLMREGRDIQAKLAKLELEMSDDDDDGEETDQPKKSMNEDKACRVMKLHLRLQQIKSEWEILENGKMREVLVRNQNFSSKESEVKRRESRGRKAEAHFVWLGGTLQETIEALKSVQDLLPCSIFLKTLDSLQDAIDTSDVGDIIVIGKGEHQIKGAGSLEEGGMFKGLYKPEQTIICPGETECGPSLLDFSGKDVQLENLTIDLRELQAGILVREGLLKLTNCHILANNESVTKLGIVVLSGAKLIAQKTKFTGLGTAIVVHDSAETILNECVVDACIEGMQLYNKSRFSASNCFFTNCKEYGIRKETEKVNDSKVQSGDVNVLQNISEVTIRDCKFDNNAKGNVTLRPLERMVVS